jgi:hypothetical protein
MTSSGLELASLQLVDTIKKNKDTGNDGSKEVDLEANSEKIKYMFLCHHENAGYSNCMKITNRPVENEAQFRYLGMTVK